MQLYTAIMVTLLVLYFASSEVYTRYQRRKQKKVMDEYVRHVNAEFAKFNKPAPIQAQAEA